MLSQFFIHRPIFAGVLAIMVMAVGIFAVLKLPVERYPDIAPPRITISTSYAGADAETVEESVTQVLEQQITGIDHLLYFNSSSDSSGRSRISLSFENGTDPDTAQVQVQNRISGVINRLPDEVQRQGVNVYKSLGDTFMVIGMYDSTGQANNIQLSDYLMSNIEQALARIDGVGEVDVFGSQYAMRIWLNPNQLKQYSLMPSDVRAAVEAQNTQVAAGGLGDLPVVSDQYLNAKVTAGSRFRTVEEFENIILKSAVDGSFVYLKDVARVELGAENYQSFNTINGFQSAGMAISLSSGAKAACLGLKFCSCIKRSTFSTTTIASSTNKPIAKTKANKVKVFILMPKIYKTAKVPKITIGTVNVGIKVARQLCKKINITITTKAIASIKVLITSLIDSCTKGVLSRG